MSTADQYKHSFYQRGGDSTTAAVGCVTSQAVLMSPTQETLARLGIVNFQQNYEKTSNTLN